MNTLFKAQVGSRTKLGRTSGDIDLRGFCVDFNIFHPTKAARKYEWRTKQSIGGELIDTDYWELCYAIRQIVKGQNSSPVLLSCLWSPLKESTELGKELIQNRSKLISKNIVAGTLKFCDRKARSKGKHPKHKYLYYACSDMLEINEILTTGDVKYPIKYPDYVLDLYHGRTEDEKLYWDLRDKFTELKINQKADVNWAADFCKRAYTCHNK